METIIATILGVIAFLAGSLWVASRVGKFLHDCDSTEQFKEKK